jgi:UDP-N-acetyl-L-fucosamine synthase
MFEVLQAARVDIEASRVLDELGVEPGRFFLASVHREENVDDPRRLARIIDCLSALAEHDDVPVIVSTHPRTRQRLEQHPPGGDPRVRFSGPFGYLAYNHLQTRARCVISDSGSISEESAILGFPAVTIRDSMERPEALDTGTVLLTGLEPDRVVDAVAFQLTRYRRGAPQPPPEYLITDVSYRVTAVILGLAEVVHTWTGVRAGPGEK